MALTPNDPPIKKFDATWLKAAQDEDRRHRLHAESAQSAAKASPYFKQWVDGYVTGTIFNRDRREQLLRQMVWPLVSNELIDEISDNASAVHYAQDRHVSVDMVNDDLRADAESYLETIDLFGFVARNCHNALFSAPNSFVIVDLPAVQATDFPAPYAYLLSSERVVAVEALSGPSDSGLLKFIYFETGVKNQRALFDQQDIAIYEKQAGTGYVEVSREPHGLPYCPAFKLWSDVEEHAPILSNTVLRPILGLLDRYVFWDAASETSALQAGFQMFWHWEVEPCDYRTADNRTCQNGIIERMPVDNFGQPVPGASPIREDCPIRHKCPNHQKYGPGTEIPVPVPRDKQDVDLRLPAGWITADVDNLKYLEEKVLKLRSRIVSTATGNESGPADSQALNEDQIQKIVEGSRQVGQYLAQHFQTLTKRLIGAICGLRYGPAYLGNAVNYGRRYSLLGGDQLALLYESAKKNGALWQIEEIDGMFQDYYARADASRLLRYKLLTDLNPYPYQAPSDLVAAQINTIDPEGYMLSAGLMGFVRQFENEQGVPLERFGILLDYPNRVTTISEILKSYVGDIRQKNSASSGQPAPGNDPGGNPNGDPGNPVGQ